MTCISNTVASVVVVVNISCSSLWSLALVKVGVYAESITVNAPQYRREIQLSV